MKFKFVVFPLLILLFLSSCTEYYFSKPQPINVDNTYLVPEKYIGIWVLQNENNSIDSIFITEKYYKRITRSQVTESKKLMESDSNIYFINNKVYTKENGDLEGGFNYTIKNDSVVIDVIDFELIEFGERAFFRKINYGYILNQRNEKMTDWWSIRFIDTRNKDGIYVRNLMEEDLKNNADYRYLHEDFKNYLIANWSSKYIESFINSGGFSDTTLVLNYKDRIKPSVKK